MAVETPIREAEEISIELRNNMGEFCVIIYNDDHNSFPHVISVLIAATDCDEKEAETEANEAHAFGKAVCHYSSEEECQSICNFIVKNGIKATVEKDPVLL